MLAVSFDILLLENITTLIRDYRPHPLSVIGQFLVSSRQQDSESHNGETTAPHYCGGSDRRCHVPPAGLLP